MPCENHLPYAALLLYSMGEVWELEAGGHCSSLFFYPLLARDIDDWVVKTVRAVVDPERDSSERETDAPPGTLGGYEEKKSTPRSPVTVHRAVLRSRL